MSFFTAIRSIFKKPQEAPPAYASYINAAEIHALYERTNARLEWMIQRRAYIALVERGEKTLYLCMDSGGALSTFRDTPYAAIDEARRIFPIISEDNPQCLNTPSVPSWE
jgi:hypothetical protein